MDHPLRTLLRDLLTDPVLRFLRIGRSEPLDNLPVVTHNNKDQPPVAADSTFRFDK